MGYLACYSMLQYAAVQGIPKVSLNEPRVVVDKCEYNTCTWSWADYAQLHWTAFTAGPNLVAEGEEAGGSTCHTSFNASDFKLKGWLLHRIECMCLEVAGVSFRLSPL